MASSSNTLPPFLKKLYAMVDDPETDSVVSWSNANNSFVVWNAHEFAANLLPKHFKHKNFSSFIRQLNTYVGLSLSLSLSLSFSQISKLICLCFYGFFFLLCDLGFLVGFWFLALYVCFLCYGCWDVWFGCFGLWVSFFLCLTIM